MDSILTVTTPAASFDLTSLDDMKAELGITTTEDDSLLSRMITQASRAAARYCNRVFASETVQEVFRLPRHHLHHGPRRIEELTLARYPVSALTSVAIDGTALASTDYELDGEKGLLYRLDGSDVRIHWHGLKVTVVYTGGYSLPAAAPEDLQRAAIELVKLSWFSKARDPMLKSLEQPGLGTKTWWVGAPPMEGNMPAEIALRLDDFRVPVVA